MNHLFLSYGHADAKEFAERLKSDLNAAGYSVWWDEKGIRAGQKWDIRIEKAIENCSVLIAILTPHSTREESICRDEVAFALVLPRKVVPAKASSEVNPTLQLVRRSWIDFTTDYDEGLQRLIEYLSGDKEVLLPPALDVLGGVKPLDFGRRLAELSWNFTGREWLLPEIEQWMTKTDKRAFVIIGDPGIGKSAIAAWSVKRLDSGVAAIHFCDSRDSRTLDPHQFVASVVAQLYGRMPDYAKLIDKLDPSKRRSSAKQSFLELVVEPAHAIGKPSSEYLIIVDSLDEAATVEGETVLDVLTEHASSLPPWLRLIMTTRPYPNILSRIYALECFVLEAKRPENERDVNEYIQRRIDNRQIKEKIDKQIASALSIQSQISQRSEGNFLVAKLVLDAIEDGYLTTDRLSEVTPGLHDFYHRAFSKHFRDIHQYEKNYYPILSVLSVAQVPLPMKIIMTILKCDARELNRRLRMLGQFVHEDEGRLSLFHKSLSDWLQESELAGDYWCASLIGHEVLGEHGWKEYQNSISQMSEYMLSHLVTHLCKSEQWDRVTHILTNLSFIEAKCAAGMVYDLIRDYVSVLESLPDTQDKRKKEKEHEERIRKYVNDLIAYAKGEISSLEIIPSVKRWTDEEIGDDIERIIDNPTRLDQIRAFFHFVNSESHGLWKFGYLSGFCIQQAYNSADSGPVARAAEAIISNKMNSILLLRYPSQRPDYNPHDALLRTLEGHIDEVWSVNITPDGKRAVSGGADTTLRVWDLESGECVGILEGHTGKVENVNITPDGKRAVSGGEDKTLRVWDLERGECVGILEGHTGKVESVSITPDGRRAVSGGEDSTLREWDLEGGKCVRRLEGHTGRVESVSITPDGRRAVSGGEDSTLLVWDLESGKCVRILEGHTDRVESVSITPDGRRAVSGGEDSTLREWDLESGECMRTLKGHIGWIENVSVTPDGMRIVSGGEDTTLRVWDPEGGKCLRRLEGHMHWIKSVSITPDGKRAVSGCADSTLRVWDLQRGECIRTLEGHTDRVKSVSITADGKGVVSGSEDTTVRVWDPEGGKCIAIYQAHDMVTSVSQIKVGVHFTCGTSAGHIIVLTLINYPIKNPVVTPLRAWLYGEYKNMGHWEDDFRAECYWCSQRFSVADEILDVIKAINRNANLSSDQSPCLELPDEAWDEPRLLSECPLCHKPLKFNPFIVDNRGRY